MIIIPPKIWFTLTLIDIIAMNFIPIFIIIMWIPILFLLWSILSSQGLVIHFFLLLLLFHWARFFSWPFFSVSVRRVLLSSLGIKVVSVSSFCCVSHYVFCTCSCSRRDCFGLCWLCTLIWKQNPTIAKLSLDAVAHCDLCNYLLNTIFWPAWFGCTLELVVVGPKCFQALVRFYPDRWLFKPSSADCA